MEITHHKFNDYWFKASEDMGGELTDLKFIVMHYTAGGSGEASRDYMLNSPTEKQKIKNSPKKVYASAHLVIDRDGSIWQIVPFNHKARHAGESTWRGLESINRYSIGIEIANYGWLNKYGDGSYGRSDTPRFAANDVTIGRMPNSTETKAWENYTLAQLDAVEQVTQALLNHYPSIREVIGHSEISPSRKFDPGPAFPIQRYRNLLDNRAMGALNEGTESSPEKYVTTVTVNFRSGPGNDWDVIEQSPLPANTPLIKKDEQGIWYFVQLENNPNIHGWIHGRYARIV